jgi:hypothetical protein
MACGSDEKPQNLIPKDKMAKILTEIHIIEAQVNNLHFQHEDSSVYVYQKMKVGLLKTYDLDTATFRSSFKYYLLNPDKLKEIYSEVKKSLEAKKKQIQAKVDLEAKKKKILEGKKAKAKALQKSDSLMRVKNEIKAKKVVKKRLIPDKLSTHLLNKTSPKRP